LPILLPMLLWTYHQECRIFEKDGLLLRRNYQERKQEVLDECLRKGFECVEIIEMGNGWRLFKMPRFFVRKSDIYGDFINISGEDLTI